MKRNKCKMVALLAVTIMLFTMCFGCGNKGTDSETAANDITAAGTAQNAVGDSQDTASGDSATGTESRDSNTYRERTVVEAPTDYVTDEMYATATAFNGTDPAAIAAVMRRAEAGEAITVGVIGGSITQGSSATSSDKAYASIMAKWWKETFPNSAVKFVNAGIGATDSYLGVHRVQADLLDYNPDFVIVEFSVNDADTNFYKTSYDNLVRKIIKCSSTPAVMLLYMVQENGTSAQGSHGMTGFSYSLPQISYGRAVQEQILAGTFKWKDISPDNIHPNDYGHAMCGEMIWKYLNNIYAQLDTIAEPVPFNKSALTRDFYINAHILDKNSTVPIMNSSESASGADIAGFSEGCADWSHFSDGWSTKDGGSITFTVKASRIGVLYYKCTNGKYAKADVLVDGAKVATLDGDFTGGWGNYGTAEQVFSAGEIEEHTVEICVDAASDKTAFDVFGILVSN